MELLGWAMARLSGVVPHEVFAAYVNQLQPGSMSVDDEMCIARGLLAAKQTSRALTMALDCYKLGAPSESEVQQGGMNIQSQHEFCSCDLQPFIQAAQSINDHASASYLAHLQVPVPVPVPVPLSLSPSPPVYIALAYSLTVWCVCRCGGSPRTATSLQFKSSWPRSRCPPARLLACLSPCLPACLPACLPVYLMPIWLLRRAGCLSAAAAAVLGSQRDFAPDR